MITRGDAIKAGQIVGGFCGGIVGMGGGFCIGMITTGYITDCQGFRRYQDYRDCQHTMGGVLMTSTIIGAISGGIGGAKVGEGFVVSIGKAADYTSYLVGKINTKKATQFIRQSFFNGTRNNSTATLDVVDIVMNYTNGVEGELHKPTMR